MQISQNLKLKQSQSLVMTPQLQQAIKLLQLTNLELCELVNKEIEENPFLEDSKFQDEKIFESESQSEVDNLEKEFENFNNVNAELKSEKYENTWDKEPSLTNKKQNFETIDPGSVAEQTLSEKVTLKSILRQQAGIEFTSQEDLFISSILIDYVEPSGWLIHDYDELKEIIGCSEQKIVKILEKMKTFEPSGVFARNLQECLKIQLLAENKLTESVSKLVDNLELLTNGNIKSLSKICNLSTNEIIQKVSLIKQLNPKPGSLYSNDEMNIFHPDVVVKNNSGKWEVELNNSTLPKIEINENYISELSKLNCNENDKKFISESIGSARWLMKAIEQRNITTLRISAELVNQQKPFFEKGVSYLKPMILKDVAKKIGMHESTVSRVTSSKLILTPRGIFDMKHFFSASINGTNRGEAHSAASVREALKTLISNEPLNQPFSDEMIVTKLQKEGINLARRTVAKYREILSIPSSAERRKMMKIQSINF